MIRQGWSWRKKGSRVRQMWPRAVVLAKSLKPLSLGFPTHAAAWVRSALQIGGEDEQERTYTKQQTARTCQEFINCGEDRSQHLSAREMKQRYRLCKGGCFLWIVDSLALHMWATTISREVRQRYPNLPVASSYIQIKFASLELGLPGLSEAAPGHLSHWHPFAFCAPATMASFIPKAPQATWLHSLCIFYALSQSQLQPG